MKATTVKKNITVDQPSLVMGLCLTLLRQVYIEESKNIVRALAAYYGLTTTTLAA